MEKFKIKPLTKEQIIISIDRLTRFKNTEVKYLRVYKDILINNLVCPKFKKTELDNMEYTELRRFAEHIFNYSLEQLGFSLDEDYLINQRLFDCENNLFKLDKNIQELLKNKINFKACLNLLNGDIPINLRWLKALINEKDLIKTRQIHKLRFPIEKILICEGITEESLLPEFAKLCGYDFDKNGVQIISAGGKNQVVKIFYQLAETANVPIFILLDNDGKDVLDELKPRLREFDRIHILKCGEFEDALPHQLIEKTLNYILKNVSFVSSESLEQDLPMVKILEEFFRHRGLHEFKKAEFAQAVKVNMSSEDDVSEEIRTIFDEIRCFNRV